MAKLIATLLTLLKTQLGPSPDSAAYRLWAVTLDQLAASVEALEVETGTEDKRHFSPGSFLLVFVSVFFSVICSFSLFLLLTPGQEQKGPKLSLLRLHMHNFKAYF